MPVAAVTLNLFNINKKQNNQKKYTNINPITSNYNQNNNLIDMNYGRSLVQSKSVSFKGNFPVEIVDLTKKVSVIYNYMQDDQILLIGKDFERARSALEKPIRKMRDVITSIFFIKDENINGSIAIKKNTTKRGFDELINLEAKPVFYRRFGEPDSNNLDYLSEGERLHVKNYDYISTKNPEYGFYIDTHEAGVFTDLPYGSVDYIDLSEDIERNIADLNLRNLKELKDPNARQAEKLMFKDVGGQDFAIEELKKKVLFQLKYPNYFRNNINQRGHGALLVGPPGNGKSLAAQAAANEANVTFFNVNPQYLKAKYVGDSEKNIKNAFEEYRANQPCIVFYDEANSIFPKRTGEATNIHTESESEVYYDEMSQLEKEGARVYFMAATNHPEQMDEAALRRFDTKIEFSNLDTPQRCKAVFDIHTRKAKITDFNADEFMKRLVQADASGDDIANLIVNAQINASERTGVFDKMAKGTFKDNAKTKFKLILTGEDFEKALVSLINQKKMVKSKSKEKPIVGLAGCIDDK